MELPESEQFMIQSNSDGYDMAIHRYGKRLDFGTLMGWFIRNRDGYYLFRPFGNYLLSLGELDELARLLRVVNKVHPYDAASMRKQHGIA